MKKSTALSLIFIAITSFNVLGQQPAPAPQFQMKDGACQGIPPVSLSTDISDRDGTGVLGESLNITRCGLDYVSGSKSITTRYTQAAPAPPNTGFPATLAIAGIPAGVVIEKAFLYWIVSYHTGSSLTPTAVITNPLGVVNNYVATMIGSGPSKCWGETGTRAFRVDVTTAVSGNGNYILNNVIGLLPWNGMPSWEIDGATLLIIYSDASASFKGTLKIDDGMVIGIATTTTLQVTNFNTCASAAYIDGFVMAADLQNNIGGPNPQHQCTINNNVYNFPNNFWNFDWIATTSTGCQQNGNFGIIPTPGDCYAYCASGIYFRIPTNPGCTINNLVLVTNFTNPNCGMMDGSASVSATNGVPPYTYLWSTGSTTAAINNLGPGSYTVTVTDACACLTGSATVVLTNNGAAMVLNTTTVDLTCNLSNDGSATATLVSGGTPPYSFAWNTVPVQANATATGLSAGTYTVVATDSGGCTASATVTINQPPAVVVNFQNVVHTLCGFNNGSAEAVGAGGTGTISYSWSTTPVQNTAIANNLPPGTYTVTATDASNCSVTGTVTINPSTPPAVTAVVLGANPICVSQSTPLDASVLGGTPPYSYNWYTPPVGLSATNIKNPIASPTVTTTFTVDVTDVDGCLSQPNSVTVNVYDPLTITPVGTTSICIGGSATISVSGTGGDGNHTYTWDNGLPNGPGPHTVSPTTTTTYNVLMTDGCNSPSLNGSVTITVSPTPVAGLQFVSVSPCPPYTALFTDASTVASPSSITQWLWTFGDGGTSSEQNPAHGYLTGGTYTVALIATTNNGCSATDSMQQIIEVTDEFTFYVPNVFTPNGDNVNETFFAIGQSIKDYSMTIYNRWGEVIFRTNSIQFAWDGKLSSGEPANEEVYNYIFAIKDICDKKHDYIGSIALIR